MDFRFRISDLQNWPQIADTRALAVHLQREIANLRVLLYPSSQNLSLRYLSPESQSMVTHTAGLSCCSRCATCSHPATAAVAEMPTRSPSSRASRTAIL